MKILTDTHAKGSTLVDGKSTRILMRWLWIAGKTHAKLELMPNQLGQLTLAGGLVVWSPNMLTLIAVLDGEAI